jgi:hypothetical protein
MRTRGRHPVSKGASGVYAIKKLGGEQKLIHGAMRWLLIQIGLVGNEVGGAN